MREQLPKIPKCPRESTGSARVSEHQPRPKRILGLLTQTLQLMGKEHLVLPAQHRTVKKHFFQTQETSLHNTGCSTVWKVPGGHKWGGQSCSWFGTNSKDAPGTDLGMCHRAPVHSWSEASGNQVRGVWNESNHANSKLQLKTLCVLEEPRH